MRLISFQRDRASNHPDEQWLHWAVWHSLADPRTWRVRIHLARCADCRKRLDAAEAELFRKFKPFELAADALLPDEESSRERLLAGIRATEGSGKRSGQRSGQETGNETGRGPAQQSDGFPSPFAVASAGVLAGAGCVAFFLVTPVHHPAATADSILVSAVSGERNVFAAGRSGILFQRVALRRGNHHIEWPVYRDMQGKRSPHFQAASSNEAAVTAEFAEAVVSREEPLSAASFKSWHDRLRIHSDSIERAPSGLIVVKTVVPASESSLIREETLTLRERDLHGVARTIGFRNADTVEIAELDYKVVPWKDAPREWFDETTTPHLPPMRAEAALSIPSRPPLSESQLALAELQARLVLSREGADFNEQIELKRQPEGILVSGLANSAERKLELQAALTPILHVTSKISTPEELESVASPTSPSSEIHAGAPMKLIDSVSQPSPLTLYWMDQNRDAKEIPAISRRLLASALIVRQQSLALKEMVSSFHGIASADEETRTVFQSLWREHQTRLRAAVGDQLKMLEAIAPSSGLAVAGAPAVSDGLDGLNAAAARSMELSRELTAGDSNGQHDAMELLNHLRIQSLQIANLSDRLSPESH